MSEPRIFVEQRTQRLVLLHHFIYLSAGARVARGDQPAGRDVEQPGVPQEPRTLPQHRQVPSLPTTQAEMTSPLPPPLLLSSPTEAKMTIPPSPPPLLSSPTEAKITSPSPTPPQLLSSFAEAKMTSPDKLIIYSSLSSFPRRYELTCSSLLPPTWCPRLQGCLACPFPSNFVYKYNFLVRVLTDGDRG